MKRDEMNSKELKEFGTKEEFWKAVKEAEINRTQLGVSERTKGSPNEANEVRRNYKSSKEIKKWKKSQKTIRTKCNPSRLNKA